MPDKTRKLRLIFIIYWILLAYILAALVWWFIALNRQNKLMTRYEIGQLDKTSATYPAEAAKFYDQEKRKTAQYAGEGVTFFFTDRGRRRVRVPGFPQTA